MWRPVHSYLSDVLVGAQEALDVAEHLGDRHVSKRVELRGAEGETSAANCPEQKCALGGGGKKTRSLRLLPSLSRGDDVIGPTSCLPLKIRCITVIINKIIKNIYIIPYKLYIK